jgi:hypothetical protein
VKTYIITFPQKDELRKDGWIRILNASTLNQVKNFADHEYHQNYACIYEEENFLEGYYPLGCLGEVDFKYWHDYVT